ncbi:MAG: NlpC/P60 family protein [Eubacteriales bacterium]|nr:NlpC/P60 family protein [Eubacteriales bacterium]
MKKRLMCLAMALLMCGTQVVSVSASREEELREEQAWTSQQLDATYARMDELWAAKQQLESEIATLDANLVDVMVSIDVLKNDISAKEVDIVRTKQDLGKAQKARDKQYEAMKKRIQYLYEKGGDDAWFQMMMNAENLADLLTRAEYTQKMYDQDRKSLDKYVNTIEEVKKLQTKYESQQAELEEMKASYEEQSVVLQNEIDARRASSANCDAEIAYAEQQATEYANLIAEQQAEIERLEAERIAAEEAARRAAEEEAARLEAEQAAQEEAEGENEEVQYDEDGNVIEDTDSSEDGSEESTEDSEGSEDVEYDEYGNVIDTDNTVSEEEYESQDAPSYSGAGSSVVDFATQFVGNPYVWGGTSLTNGADCSGFTQSVYANFGVSIPRTSYEQQNAGYEVPYSEAQPGDLICYGGHVAIYMGNGQIVHASNSRDGIKISNDATYRTILSVRRLV